MQSCLYFGTFNPIHTGHLMIAEAAQTLGFRNITFIPANNPPHREDEPDLLPARHRLNMVKLATASNPGFKVSDIELQRPGRSYTIDTIRLLMERGEVAAPVPMIIGSDALARLATWHEPQALIDTVRFIQAPRPDYPLVETIHLKGTPVTLDTVKLDLPVSALSSTWIRQRLKAEGPSGLRYALPEAVRRYIAENGLYA
jgi:nicotinate-nucleotide adenylyltransferase